MRHFSLAACAGVALTLVGCTAAPQHTLGKPDATASSVLVGSLLPVKVALPPQPVLVRGTMVEKCPASGCWLRLKDGSGTIKVDLRAISATATEIAPGTELTVTGTATRVGDEPTLEASGVTY